MRLVAGSLIQAVNDPSTESRSNMARAAHLSGKAINITKTTAPHAISYPLTSHFDIPHGHAVALLLAPMLVFNSEATESDVVDLRGVDYVKSTIEDICHLLGCRTASEAARWLDGTMSRIGLASRLHALRLTPEDVDTVVAHGLDPHRAGNNPRKVTSADLRTMLQSIY